MINNFIKKHYSNKDKLSNYLQELYFFYNNIKNYNLNSNYTISYLNTFIPLPSKLIVNDLYIDDDKIEIKDEYKYIFLGKTGLRLLFADKILPFNNNNITFPIPFSFPIINNNKLEIYQSNIYYFELSILNEINNNIDNNYISIGFGNNNISFKSHVGWDSNSIGFHSHESSIYINSYQKSYSNISDIWKPGDIIGAGIIYINDNIIKPFFTFNGKLVYIYNSLLKIQSPYFPIIGYNHNYTIELNFSQKQFKYDIVSLINKYNHIISINNTFLYNNNINNYINTSPIKDNNNYNNFLNIFNLIIPIELISIE